MPEGSAWQQIAQRPGPNGWIEVVTKSYKMPDGSQVDWDIMKASDAVSVVAVTHSGLVLLVRQFRPGPGRILDELPGGEVNDGESPLEAGIRELAEETGYRGNMTVVGHTWQGANITRRKWAAVATDCMKVGEAVPDPSEEFCETLVVSLEEFKSALRSGQLTDGWAAYKGLEYLGMLGSNQL